MWIEFEAGDVSKPIWSGCWWPKDKLPKGADGKPVKPAAKLLRSEQGLRVALDDDKQTLSLGDADGKNLLTIAVKDGQVTIKAAKKVVIDCPAIELVGGASHTAVHGDSLLDFLNNMVTSYKNHMHPGQATGPGGGPVTPTPPQPPMQQATKALLSDKVRLANGLEGNDGHPLPGLPVPRRRHRPRGHHRRGRPHPRPDPPGAVHYPRRTGQPARLRLRPAADCVFMPNRDVLGGATQFLVQGALQRWLGDVD